MTIIENGYRYYQRKQAGTKEVLSSSPNTAWKKMKFGDGSLMDDNSSFWTRVMTLWNT